MFSLGLELYLILIYNDTYFINNHYNSLSNSPLESRFTTSVYPPINFYLINTIGIVLQLNLEAKSLTYFSYSLFLVISL